MKTNERRDLIPGARECGFGLVDLFAGMTILTIALVTLATGAVGASRHADDTNASIVLSSAHRNIVEALRVETLADLVTNYGSGSGQEEFWCDEAGTIFFSDPGNATATGKIEIFDDESLVPDTFAGASGGLDLNGDGAVSSGAVSQPKMLAVRLTIAVGNRTLTSSILIPSDES